jgi:hypothetical protein
VIDVIPEEMDARADRVVGNGALFGRGGRADAIEEVEERDRKGIAGAGNAQGDLGWEIHVKGDKLEGKGATGDDRKRIVAKWGAETAIASRKRHTIWLHLNVSFDFELKESRSTHEMLHCFDRLGSVSKS